MRWTAACLLMAGLLVAGCRSEDTSSSRDQTDDLARYGYLPGLKASADARLQDELARLVEENATPELLQPARIPDEENVAAGLRGLFSQRELPDLLAESARYLPLGDFTFPPGVEEAAKAFARKYEPQRLKARQALERPRCSFEIDYLRGNFDPMSFIDTVELYARLEQIHAAAQLQRSRSDEAIEALKAILRLSRCLDGEKHLVTRLKAAYLRSDALALLLAIVQRVNPTRQQLSRLYLLVEDQLSGWPNDADAWVGDRAMGLHAYEVVRDGHLLALLTDDEIDEWRKLGDVVALARQARKNADADELYYLQTMRRIIESCRRPFYKRQDLFNSIDHDLAVRQGSADYPLVAGRLLLPGIRQAQETQARDRANWEALALALAAATGRPLPEFKQNPLTGKPYRLTREQGFVVVSGVAPASEDDTPIRIPALADSQ